MTRMCPTRHPQLLPRLQQLRLTLAVGQYGQAGLLAERRGRTLTDTAQAWRHLQHGDPSPRNRLWLAHNPWLEGELLPALRWQVAEVLRTTPRPEYSVTETAVAPH